MNFQLIYSVPDRDRTCGLEIRNLSLYPTELRRTILLSSSAAATAASPPDDPPPPDPELDPGGVPDEETLVLACNCRAQ